MKKLEINSKGYKILNQSQFHPVADRLIFKSYLGKIKNQYYFRRDFIAEKSLSPKIHQDSMRIYTGLTF